MAKQQPKSLIALADSNAAIIVGEDGEVYVWNENGGEEAISTKPTVRVAILSSIPSYTSDGNVITATSNGALPAQDGVSLVQSDSVLLAIGTSADNGIYVVTAVGSGSTPFVLTRRSDANTSQKFSPGMRVTVLSGTNYSGIWSLSTTGTIALNTTPLTFVSVDPVSGLIQVDSYAALRAIPSATTTPRLLRDTAAAAALAGVFFFNPSSTRTDPGSHFKPNDISSDTAGRRERIGWDGERSVKWHQAKGDGQASTTSTSTGVATVTVSGLTAADVGKRCLLPGAGVSGAHLATVIDGVSGTTITLHTAPSTTLETCAFLWGTDDTDAITEAITSAVSVASAPGQVVYIPAGTFDVWVTGGGTNHALELLSHVKLKGAGRDVTVIRVMSPLASSERAVYANARTDFAIEDLTIECGAQRGVVQGVYLEGCTHYAIRNVAVNRSLLQGIAANYGCDYGVIDKCWVYDCGAAGAPTLGFGIVLFGNGTHNYIGSCLVESLGVTGWAGIYIDGSETINDGGPSQYNLIEHNHVKDYKVGIGVEDSHDNYVQHNDVEGWTKSAYVCQGGQKNLAPRRNLFFRNVGRDAAAADGNGCFYAAGCVECSFIHNDAINVGTNHSYRQGRNYGVTDIAAPARWAKGTGYTIGDRVAAGFNIYACASNGTSATTGSGPTGTGTGISDASTSWDFVIAHPGQVARNTWAHNLVNGASGSGMFIETGLHTKVIGMILVDADPGTPGVDAPIRIENTCTDSVIDAPIDDVLIEQPTIYGGGASPGISIQTRSDNAMAGIGTVRIVRPTVQDIDGNVAVLVRDRGQPTGPVYIENPDGYDSASGTAAWINGTAYGVGDLVLNDTRKFYRCITAGTSAGSGGPTGTGADITDNTVHWAYVRTLMTAVVQLYSATGNVPVVRVTAIQNRITGGENYIIDGGFTFIRDGRLPVDVTWDPGTITTGTLAVKADVTARGARVGDAVVVSSPYDGNTAATYGDLQVHAFVQQTNYIQIRVNNPTATPRAPGSATWHAEVLRG